MKDAESKGDELGTIMDAARGAINVLDAEEERLFHALLVRFGELRSEVLEGVRSASVSAIPSFELKSADSVYWSIRMLQFGSKVDNSRPQICLPSPSETEIGDEGSPASNDYKPDWKVEWRAREERMGREITRLRLSNSRSMREKAREESKVFEAKKMKLKEERKAVLRQRRKDRQFVREHVAAIAAADELTVESPTRDRDFHIRAALSDAELFQVVAQERVVDWVERILLFPQASAYAFELAQHENETPENDVLSARIPVVGASASISGSGLGALTWLDLKDGYLLCRVLERIRPGLVLLLVPPSFEDPFSTGPPWNLEVFLKGCRELGIEPFECGVGWDRIIVESVERVAQYAMSEVVPGVPSFVTYSVFLSSDTLSRRLKAIRECLAEG